ncbi:hypothetical protein [Neobacillus sp.]|uniref:hypothetical protein n=1 Tax=Neobacillus sp. TaxID=2675273 RepID=UPI0035B5282E
MGRNGVSDQAGRRELYEELLACTNAQYELISSGDSWEHIADHFLQLSARWDEIRAQIDRLRPEPEELNDSDGYLQDLIRRIAIGLREVDNKLQQSVGEAGTGLKTVKDQQKLMNAYYGMDRRGSHAYYFDEKK